MMVELKFDDRGLIPTVVQDATTGEVLMVAWMNAESLRLTQETGEAHFWSRSRQELWHKGATSGNVQRVREIWVDCDADTLLLKVDPAGPACHTGERSCFFRQLETAHLLHSPRNAARLYTALNRALLNEGQPQSVNDLRIAVGAEIMEPDILDELFSVILERKANPQSGSYTVKLLFDVDEALKKVGEEAIEVVLAGKGQSDERLISEAADLIYHLLVVLAARNLTLDDVRDELARRRK